MNYANHIGHSDVTPYEIVRVVSDKTVEIRRMNAERDSSFKPEFVLGGFAGHCTNQRKQSWVITSDPTANVIRIRKGKNGWKDAHGGKYQLADKPFKFYDYNF